MLKRISSRTAAPFKQLMGFAILTLTLVVTQAQAVPYALKAAIEEAQLLPTPLPAEDEFMGGSVAIDGTRALVGATKLSGEGVVYVFEKSGSNWFRSAMLQPSGPRTSDRFGESVALAGDKAVVGAYQDSSGFSQAGAAYLFEYDGNDWIQMQTFTASDAAENLRFGRSVSISPDGSAIAIGSTPNFGVSDPGAVYVFFEGFANSWSENEKLQASDGHAGNFFGGAVSLGTDRLLVGASQDDETENNSGAVYIFDYDNGMDVWSETEKLKADTPESLGFFGIAVDLDGDQMIVGERGRDSQTGAAHIYSYEFSFSGWAWEKQQTLTASDASTGDYFGAAVAIESSTALVGAISAASSHTTGSPGAIYAFSESAGTWSEDEKIAALDGHGQDDYGQSIALDGTQFVTGNSLDDDSGDNAGAGYAYELDTGSWTLKTKLLSHLGPYEDDFGVSVANTDTFAVIGAPENDEAGTNAGTAYVFMWDGSQWTYLEQIFAADAQNSDRFGSAVAIFDNRIVVGAPYRSDSATQAGAAYVFEYVGGNWSQSQKLMLPLSSGYDNFGTSVDITMDRLIVGTPGEDLGAANAGAAHIFEYGVSTWVFEDVLEAPDALSNADCGISVAIEADWAVMGCDSDDEHGASSGAAYLFARNNMGDWLFDEKIVGDDTLAGDNFGRAADLDDGILVIGSVFDDAEDGNAGAAFVFDYDGNDWNQVTKLVAPDGDGAGAQWFGADVAIDGDFIVAGAHAQSTGKTYVFQNFAGAWTWIDTISNVNTQPFGNFGRSVSVVGEQVIIGANQADGHGLLSGTAFAYNIDILPIAVDDTAETDEDQFFTISVLDNDTDPDGGDIVIASITQPTNGSASINGDDIQYIPLANYCNDGNPTDDFTYTLTSGSTATVNVIVNCVDDAPIATDDEFTINEDSATQLNVRNNDFDNDSAPNTITIVSVTQPANGSTSHDGDTVTYTPDANYCNGGSPTDDFSYELNGGNTAMVSVTVNCLDDPAAAVLDAVDVNEDTSTLIDVTANDTDIDGGTIAITDFTQPSDGSVTQEAGGLRYTPEADDCNDVVTAGTTFTYTITGGDTAAVEIRLLCVNDQPDFEHLGDVVATQAQSEVIPDWAFNIDFGASNENAFQQVEDFLVTIVSDTDAVLSAVDVANNGTLSFTTTGNVGVAIIDVALQDNGGTALGGLDTSPVKTFTITFDDTIFADNFEVPGRAVVVQKLWQWQFQHPGAGFPHLDVATNQIWYNGFHFTLPEGVPGKTTLYWLNMWLAEVQRYAGNP